MTALQHPRRIEYSVGGKVMWAQRPCLQCGAWLATMPERAEPSSDGFVYTWTCPACGADEEFHSTTPPDDHDSEPDLHTPGERPEPPHKNPEGWPNAATLSDEQRSLITACWNFIETVAGAVYIPRIGVLWDLEAALSRYDFDMVLVAASRYQDETNDNPSGGQDEATRPSWTRAWREVATALKALRKSREDPA